MKKHISKASVFLIVCLTCLVFLFPASKSWADTFATSEVIIDLETLEYNVTGFDEISYDRRSWEISQQFEYEMFRWWYPGGCFSSVLSNSLGEREVITRLDPHEYHDPYDGSQQVQSSSITYAEYEVGPYNIYAHGWAPGVRALCQAEISPPGEWALSEIGYAETPGSGKPLKVIGQGTIEASVEYTVKQELSTEGSPDHAAEASAGAQLRLLWLYPGPFDDSPIPPSSVKTGGKFIEVVENSIGGEEYLYLEKHGILTASLDLNTPPNGFLICSYGVVNNRASAATPVPGTLLLLGSGLAGLAVVRRKFKKK